MRSHGSPCYGGVVAMTTGPTLGCWLWINGGHWMVLFLIIEVCDNDLLFSCSLGGWDFSMTHPLSFRECSEGTEWASWGYYLCKSVPGGYSIILSRGSLRRLACPIETYNSTAGREPKGHQVQLPVKEEIHITLMSSRPVCASKSPMRESPLPPLSVGSTVLLSRYSS